jgi:Holliday junction DNA helicase RuvA
VIASLRGTLAEAGPAHCVIDIGGVGYLVQVSSQTARVLPPPGSAVHLRTRQIVREDSVQLFGFADTEELALFDLLIGVSGVGPKLAIAVLSGLRAPALAQAIRAEQLGALVAIPGVGRKTAERLVVELRDKLEGLPVATPRDGGVLPRSQKWDDAVAALTQLGYTAAQSEEAVRRGAGTGSEKSVEELIKRALALLAKPVAASR